MKKPTITYSVALPFALAFKIEDMNRARQEQGRTALTDKQFLTELIALGVEEWENRNSRKRTAGMDLEKLFSEFDQEVLKKRKPLLKRISA